MKTRISTLGHLVLILAFCAGLQSCNQDEFYEKEFLDNPLRTVPSNTTGMVEGGGQAGMDGGTQGGVEGGVEGGTTGGTTGSSTTGGTDGSTVGGTDGSTVGGTDGSTVGGTDGSTVGGTDGSTVGGTDGSTVGGTDGSTVGGTDGSTVGGTDGSTVGGTDGSTVGGTDGSTVGGTDGSTVGGTDGSTDGGTDGSTVGGTDGSTVGGTDGSTVGGTDGSTVGGTDGSTVGGTDGSTVGGTDGGSTGGGTIFSETFNQASGHSKVDILWVMDNSGSMRPYQQSLARNFDIFINDFIDMDIDFRMGITTTDTTSPHGVGYAIPGSLESLTNVQAKANEQAFKSVFKAMINVGTNGSSAERGLLASSGFVGRYQSTWMRPDAYLVVVYVSDEEDQSPGSVNQYLNALRATKINPGKVKVYSIVDSGLSRVPGRGINVGYERYAAASRRTGGIVANIMHDFHDVLASIGNSVIELLDSFALAHTPVNGSLRVLVNGVATDAYTYHSSTRAIKFHPGHIPPVGSEIVVSYQILEE